MERNKYLEIDGLAYKSDTHEWFNDKHGTNKAQEEDLNYVKLPHIICYVVRNIKTGEYDRIVFDKKKNEIIYDTKSIDDLGFFINRMKIAKHFKQK